jgi:hypothetical protein
MNVVMEAEQKNLINGCGTMHVNLTTRYIGEWKNKMFHGFGIIISDKDVYAGFFCRGLKHGYGTNISSLTLQIGLSIITINIPGKYDVCNK